MDPLRIVFIISDYELNLTLCSDCIKSNRKVTMLNLSGFAAQVVRQVVETLSMLRYLYCSPEDFRGHLCWNFVLTSSTSSPASNRNLTEWYEFSKSDIDKLRDYIEIIKNPCSCVASYIDDADYISIERPFQWTLLSSCIRNCLMQCRWSDRIACTPQKADSTNDSTSQSITNHIVLLGGIPRLPEILEDNQPIDKLIERLLLLDGDNQTNLSLRKNKSVQQASSSMFSKKKVSLSIISIPEVRSFLIEEHQTKYVNIVKEAVHKISDGYFSQCAPFNCKYSSEFMQIADHFGTIVNGFFSTLIPFSIDNQENIYTFLVEFNLKGTQIITNCMLCDNGHLVLNNFLNQSNSKNNTLTLTNVEVLNEFSSQLLFKCIPLCIGYVKLKFPLKSRYFIGELKSNNSHREHDKKHVIINFFPYSGYFTISYMEDLSLEEINKSPQSLNVRTWFRKAKALKAMKFPSINGRITRKRLKENWEEDLVPIFEHVDYAPAPHSTYIYKPVDIYNFSLKEAVYEYKKYFQGLLNSDIIHNPNCSDAIQRGLLSGGLKLKDFLANEELWFGPAEFVKSHKGLRARVLARSRTGSFDRLAVRRGITGSLVFQFETALVLGQLQNAKAPSLGLVEAEEPDYYAASGTTCNSDDDSIFEIVNFLRWAVSNHPEAGIAASHCLHKRFHGGCKFAMSVYIEMQRDLSASPTKSIKRVMPLTESVNSEPVKKRQSFPLATKETRNLVDEYRKYAKRYSGVSFSNTNLRFVNMKKDEWHSNDNDFYVPDTPRLKDVVPPENENKEKGDKKVVDFSIAETPYKAAGTARFMDPVRRALEDKNAEKNARKIVTYRAKINGLSTIISNLKTLHNRHMLNSKELKYRRKLKLLTSSANVKRQLFPEFGAWYSSESSSGSDRE